MGSTQHTSMQTQRNGARAVEENLGAFACERSTGAATLLRLRQTLGLGLGIADDLRTISRSSALVFAGVGFRGLMSNAA